jgi:hypothetical protein
LRITPAIFSGVIGNPIKDYSLNQLQKDPVQCNYVPAHTVEHCYGKTPMQIFLNCLHPAQENMLDQHNEKMNNEEYVSTAGDQYASKKITVNSLIHHRFVPSLHETKRIISLLNLNDRKNSSVVRTGAEGYYSLFR